MALKWRIVVLVHIHAVAVFFVTIGSQSKLGFVPIEFGLLLCHVALCGTWAGIGSWRILDDKITSTSAAIGFAACGIELHAVAGDEAAVWLIALFCFLAISIVSGTLNGRQLRLGAKIVLRFSILHLLIFTTSVVIRVLIGKLHGKLIAADPLAVVAFTVAAALIGLVCIGASFGFFWLGRLVVFASIATAGLVYVSGYNGLASRYLSYNELALTYLTYVGPLFLSLLFVQGGTHPVQPPTTRV